MMQLKYGVTEEMIERYSDHITKFKLFPKFERLEQVGYKQAMAELEEENWDNRLQAIARWEGLL